MKRRALLSELRRTAKEADVNFTLARQINELTARGILLDAADYLKGRGR